MAKLTERNKLRHNIKRLDTLQHQKQLQNFREIFYVFHWAARHSHNDCFDYHWTDQAEKEIYTHREEEEEEEEETMHIHMHVQSFATARRNQERRQTEHKQKYIYKAEEIVHIYIHVLSFAIARSGTQTDRAQREIYIYIDTHKEKEEIVYIYIHVLSFAIARSGTQTAQEDCKTSPAIYTAPSVIRTCFLITADEKIVWFSRPSNARQVVSRLTK